MASTILAAQEFMTIGEVFDFAVGDKFQITGMSDGQPPNADRITITGKYYSADGDTVFYIRYHNSYLSYVENNQLVYSFWTETDTVSYTNLNTSLTSSSYWISYDTTMIEYDTLNYINESLCDSLVNGYFYGHNAFEPVYDRRLYGKGLGRVEYYHNDPAEFYQILIKLTYYERNGIGCGIPDSTTVSVLENRSANAFGIFPNPTDNYFIIRNSTGKIFTLEIYTTTGTLVRSQTCEANESFIDCEALKPGLYLIRLSQLSKTQWNKLVIR